MGKNKKRKSSVVSHVSNIDTDTSTSISAAGQEKEDESNNPLYKQQKAFLSCLTRQERDLYFSTHSTSSITPERRAEIWMQQADIGEDLINRYAWATPTEECRNIFIFFSPLIEIGCGSNAYWAKYMKHTAGVDVLAFDRNIHQGGKICSLGKEKKEKKKKSSDGTCTGSRSGKVKDASNLIVLQQGGPEVLQRPEFKSRTLFLCYPDEEDILIDNHDGQPPLSFGWQCLNTYKGTYVIHVGELAFLDSSLNLEQAPWGRSSSPEFQQRLASEFHCIAKIQLPNWLHVRDSISVWKRSELCEMCFVGDAEDEDVDSDEDIVEYRHIPKEEMLPSVMVAPCMAHLLQPSEIGSNPTNSCSAISSNWEKPPMQNDSHHDMSKVPPIKCAINTVAGDHFSLKSASLNLTESTKKSENNEVDSKMTKKKKRKDKQKKVPASLYSSSDNDMCENNNRRHQKKMSDEFSSPW